MRLHSNHQLMQLSSKGEDKRRVWALDQANLRDDIDRAELFRLALSVKVDYGPMGTYSYGAADLLRAPIDPALRPDIQRAFRDSSLPEGSKTSMALAGVLAGDAGALLEYLISPLLLYQLEGALARFDLGLETFSLTEPQRQSIPKPSVLHEQLDLISCAHEDFDPKAIEQLGADIAGAIAGKLGMLLMTSADSPVYETFEDIGYHAGLRLERLGKFGDIRGPVESWRDAILKARETWSIPDVFTREPMAWLRALEELALEAKVSNAQYILAQSFFVRAWLQGQADRIKNLKRKNKLEQFAGYYRLAASTPKQLRAPIIDELEQRCGELPPRDAMLAMANTLSQVWNEALQMDYPDGFEPLFTSDFYSEIDHAALIAAKTLPVEMHAEFLVECCSSEWIPLDDKTIVSFSLLDERSRFRELALEVLEQGTGDQRLMYLTLLSIFAPTWSYEVLGGKLIPWLEDTAWAETVECLGRLGAEQLLPEMIALHTAGDHALAEAIALLAAITDQQETAAEIEAANKASDGLPGRSMSLTCQACGVGFGARITHCVIFETEGNPADLGILPRPECPHCGAVDSWKMPSIQTKFLATQGRMMVMMDPPSYPGERFYTDPAPGEISFSLAARFFADGTTWATYEEGLDILHAAVEKNPQDAHQRHRLGAIYRALIQRDKAIESFEKAVELDPTSMKSWMEIKRYAQVRGDHNRATEAAWKVIENLHHYDDFDLRFAAFEESAEYLAGRPPGRFGITLTSDPRVALEHNASLPRQGTIRSREVEWDALIGVMSTGIITRISRTEEPHTSDAQWSQFLRRFGRLILGGEQETQGTFQHDGAKIGRNDPCPCGSGKKYKKCCLRK